MINIPGGITAPIGFKAAGVACGLKKNGNKDLALVYSDSTAVAVGVYTTNVVKGHSLQLTINNMRNGYIDAILINSGCANACVGQKGYDDAEEIADYCAKALGCDKDNIVFGSTGVIGMPLNTNAIKTGIDDCVKELSYEGGHQAATSIMTTDTICKEVAVDIMINGKHVKIGGMAKGSGMIHPNMATMICTITTDANISKKVLDPLFKKVINHTFNRVSVDGDTSVCDMAIMMANGESDDEVLNNESEDFSKFEKALDYVCTTLSKLIAKDGEGATKLIEVLVKGANTELDAYTIASAIAKSPLVKTAMFGEDANCGRILTAAGYSGVKFDPNKVDVYIGELLAYENGVALPFDEAAAKEILKKDEVQLTIDLKTGDAFERMWTCDFSYDYVKINGSYRS
jgi:glutamate N-acetyltransferase/amino-acid N-acetyltransferase